MCKVSVCITSYNLEKYISQAIDSVIKQITTFDYEILIGDDCSTDRTRAILLDYQKKYPDKIRLHFQERNVGVNRQDYDLINMAQGEYIAWLDGDDWWITDDKLEKEVKILDENPKFSCVHTAWRDYEEESRKYKDVWLHPKQWESEIYGQTYIEKFLLKQTCGCRLSSLMFRSNIIKNYFKVDSDAFLTVPHLQNDFMLFCILSYFGPFFYLDEITTCYRIIKGSLSHNKSSRQIYKYNLGYFYAVTHIISVFNIADNLKQCCIKTCISEGLFPYISLFNSTEDLNNIIQTYKTINYKPPFKQQFLLMIVRIPILNLFLKQLYRYKIK